LAKIYRRSLLKLQLVFLMIITLAFAKKRHFSPKIDKNCRKVWS
jgi:hypothetical protein